MSLTKTLLSLSLAMPTFLGAFAFQAEAVPDGVRQLVDRWSRAYNIRDAEALAALYAEDAHLTMHGSPAIRGRRDIVAFWARDFGEHDPITALDVTHAAQGIDMMLVRGDYRVFNRADGTPLERGRFAHIWMQADTGDWVLDQEVWNEPDRN